jgi:hypothetical protein
MFTVWPGYKPTADVVHRVETSNSGADWYTVQHTACLMAPVAAVLGHAAAMAS